MGYLKIPSSRKFNYLRHNISLLTIDILQVDHGEILHLPHSFVLLYVSVLVIILVCLCTKIEKPMNGIYRNSKSKGWTPRTTKFCLCTLMFHDLHAYLLVSYPCQDQFALLNCPLCYGDSFWGCRSLPSISPCWS